MKPRATIIFRAAVALSLTALAGAATYAYGPVALADRLPLERCDLLVAVDRDQGSACYRHAVRRSLDGAGIAKVTALDAVAEREPAFRANCHRILHLEGRRIGRASDGAQRVVSALRGTRQRLGACSAGLTHGVLEGYVERHGTEQADMDVFELMCMGVADRIGRFNCAHGLGHAVNRHNDMRVAPTARFCSGLPHPEATDCRSAAHMTLVEGVRLDGGPYARFGSIDKVTEQCEDFGPTDRSLCFRWLALLPAFTPAITMSDVASTCSALDVARDRMACMVGLGRQHDPDGGLDPCAGLTSAVDEVACGYGLAVGRLLNANGGTVEEMARLCGRVSARGRSGCAVGVGRLESALGDGGCADLDGDLRHWCMTGRRLHDEPLDGSTAETALLDTVAGGRT